MLDLFGNEIEDDQPKKRKDWNGSKYSVFTCNGARTYAQEDRQSEDFYATEPRAVYDLLEREFLRNDFRTLCWNGSYSKCIDRKRP